MSQRRALWLQRVAHLQHTVLDLLFPPQCVACQAYGTRFCAACAQLVQPVGPLICDCCGRPQASQIAQCAQCQARAAASIIVRIAALHTTPLREAIHALKYDNCPELAEPLARYLCALMQTSPWSNNLPIMKIDAVVPVPLHTERYHIRGYNQAEVLASAFCRSIQYPLRSTWLVRQRSTQSQVGLTAVERQQNVQDAFVADPAVYGKRLLLIDDVYTTGATMRACAQAALDAGATVIYGLALACPK